MSLCSACSRISVPNLTRELDDLPPYLSDLYKKSNKLRGMVHLDNAQHLIASASAGCSFCELIVHAALQEMSAANRKSSVIANQSSLDKSEHDLHQLQIHLVPQPIYLQTNCDPLKPSFPEDGTIGSWHIRGLKALVPVDHVGVLVGRIRLYAARDTPAGISCDIIGRPSLLSSDSPEAFDLVNRWMRTCLTKHQTCRESFSSTLIDDHTPPILPSRVIDVGKSGLETSPRLLETAGKRGHYVALSHCWGPPAHRPLMTTQSSLAQHLTSIPWGQLPRTYQEAITATRRLDFEYIWIDSICIIQDSHADWLSESQRMGDVYQHARLTIAASHAADSNQSCFSIRPPTPTAVELPYVNHSGHSDGSIFASVLSSDYASISPESGPLAYRGWATQEWLLSRRMIFYTAKSLVWSCKTVSQRETGASFHSTARNARWKNVIEKYSARQLTKMTDRLVALEGIRSEMSKKKGDDTYCFGLWKNSMPDQLLWYCLQPGERSKCELDLPSWTWASTVHGVRFLSIDGAKNTCEDFRFDQGTHSLTIRGALRRLPSITTFNEADSTLLEDGTMDGAPYNIVSTNMVFAIQLDDGRPSGWCVLDEGSLPLGNIYCLQLMSKTSRLQANGKKRNLYGERILLLRNADRETEVFERIGTGKITTSTPWFRDCAARPVTIR